ncbi:MAG: carboxypeptidase-like regulatory domain-containing protein, partial [Spirosomataceae bacterium]
MLKKQLFSLVLCVALAFQAVAQDRIVTGKVTSSEDGSELPGATVSVKGSNTTTITNNDGEYLISVSGSKILVFSFVGFVKNEVSTGNKSRVDVA